MCLGIIYTRGEIQSQSPFGVYGVKELTAEPTESQKNIHVTAVDSLRSITSVVKDFKFFVKEKWEIASDRSGSGNTANIGSITKVEDILNGNGMFKDLGEKWFDDYWMNYGRIITKDSKGVSKKITKLSDFLEFKGKNRSLINPRAKKVRVKKG